MAAWRSWLSSPVFGLLLAGAAMAWRAAVRSHSIVTFDAGLHANGLRDYDVPSGQPHPPGYPVSVFAGRIVDAVVHDPVAAMVWLSVLWTGVTVYLLWAFGERFGGKAAGTAAALLFMASPLALLHGASGLTYSAEAAAGTGLAWAAWHAGQAPSRRSLLVLGAVAALATGLRPSALFFLAPLAAWPIVRRAGWRQATVRAGWTAAAAVPVALAWAIPMFVYGGGLRRVLAANAVQSRTVVFTDTVFQDGTGALAHNLHHLAGYAPLELRALPWLIAASLASVACLGAAAARQLLRAGRTHAAFLAVWALPALLFYALVYVGWPVYPPGYLMVVLPPVSLALSLPAAAALRRLHGRRRAVAALACIALLAVPLAHAPAAWREGTRPIREADAWAASWEDLDEAFPPERSALVMTESWQQVKLEHPEYLAWVRARYDHREGEVYTRGIESRGGVDSPPWFELVAMDPWQAPVHAIPDWVERIVLHEGHPYTGEETLVKDSVVLQQSTLPSGRVVRWFEPRDEWRAIESYFPEVDPAWSEARLAAQEAGTA